MTAGPEILVAGGGIARADGDPLALDVLDQAPHLRCSWGKPSEYGLATSVATVTPAQSTAITGALSQSGFACSDLDGGTLCERASQGSQTSAGEIHYVRGNGWVATHWIGFRPDGYTQDIIATLWK